VAAVTTVTVAVAVTAVSFTEVAVIVTVLGEGAVAGAVYLPLLGSIVPTPVVVGTDQVTTWQLLAATVLSHPGLLTVAAKVKCSLVPIVAVVGLIEMLMPEMIVTVAVAVLVVSACAAAVIVAVGVIVVVPFVVTVGIVFGAV
jgi:hypothetical protein